MVGRILGYILKEHESMSCLLHNRDSFILMDYAGAYLGFEITGANQKISPVFLIDCFLLYKPILSVSTRSIRLQETAK